MLKYRHSKTTSQYVEKGGYKLRLPDNRNDAGELLTITQACRVFNLGESSVRRIATQAGAVRKIGRNYRIKKDVFMKYIDKQYSANPSP